MPEDTVTGAQCRAWIWDLRACVQEREDLAQMNADLSDAASTLQGTQP